MFYPVSNDIYRYLWDGWLSLSGLNPYEFVPNSVTLEMFSESRLFGLLDWHFNSAATPYPPVAQALFVIPARLYLNLGLVWAQFVLGWMPILGIALLLWERISKRWWVVFWLNPFIWIHLARDGHIDGWLAMVATAAGLLLFSRRSVLSGVMLALAVLIKPYSVVWLPFFIKRGGWRMLLVFGIVILGAYLPYNYSLDRYVTFTNLMREWQPGFVKPAVGVVVMGVATIFILRRGVSWGSLTIAGIIGLLVSPVIYPWYGLWLWPTALLSKNRWMVLAVAIALVLISPRA